MTFPACRCPGIRLMLLVIVWLIVPGAASAVAAQGEDASPVDLARVPLRPSELPAPGFQVWHAGSEDGHAWATFNMVNRSDLEDRYTIRYDCYALPGKDASLVMSHMFPMDLWEAEEPKGERLRDAIQLPSAVRPTSLNWYAGGGMLRAA